MLYPLSASLLLLDLTFPSGKALLCPLLNACPGKVVIGSIFSFRFLNRNPVYTLDIL